MASFPQSCGNPTGFTDQGRGWADQEGSGDGCSSGAMGGPLFQAQRQNLCLQFFMELAGGQHGCK